MKIFNRRLTIRLLSLLIIAAAAVSLLSPCASALDSPELQAEAALLVEAETGQILYVKNETDRRAPASLTKIMTVLLAIEAYDSGDAALDDVVTVSDTAYTGITPDGSTANLKVGEELTFESLLYCAMLASANEACNVLAEYVSGDIDSFVELMNSRAKDLGCTGTHFANTHGMPNDDHYTTANDLYLIVRCALEYPLFKKLVSTVTYTVPATNMSEERQLTNTNLLIRPESVYYYAPAAGVKTGYTDAAGYCLISDASKDGRELISVVLGAKSVVIADGTTQVQSFSETRRLLNWGFDNFSYQEIISTINLIAELPVELGKGSSSVVLRPASGIRALLSNDVDLSQVQLETRIYSEESGETLQAPIMSGTVLGEVTVSLDGVDYGTVDLVANTNVELDKAAYIKHEIKKTLSNIYVKLAIVFLLLLLCGYIAFIIIYNKNRRKKKAAADALARKRIEELRRNEGASTGRSFEEIEARHRNRK
ncbi:MAG: serine hydrolase [Oscillospiraceae bacterium]